MPSRTSGWRAHVSRPGRRSSSGWPHSRHSVGTASVGSTSSVSSATVWVSPAECLRSPARARSGAPTRLRGVAHPARRSRGAGTRPTGAAMSARPSSATAPAAEPMPCGAGGPCRPGWRPGPAPGATATGRDRPLAGRHQHRPAAGPSRPTAPVPGPRPPGVAQHDQVHPIQSLAPSSLFVSAPVPEPGSRSGPLSSTRKFANGSALIATPISEVWAFRNRERSR
jgi:hypothetical protein